MRFTEFLSESQFDLQKFMKDCKYAIEQCSGQFLLHGDRNAPLEFKICKFRERKTPRDSSVEMHDAINEFLEDRFGHPFRNGLFTTGDYNIARTYGRATMIFPIGEFEWLSTHDIADLYGTYDDAITKIRREQSGISFDETRKLAMDVAMNAVTNAKWIHNKDLADCIESNKEIMLWCDSYYEIAKHSEISYEVIDYIQGNKLD